MHINTKIAAMIIGLILAIFLVVGGFFLFQSRFGKAADLTPEDVTVTVEDSTSDQPSSTMTWSTKAETLSIVHYGTSITALNLVDFDKENTNASKTHTVKLSGLASGTTYYFEICPEKENCVRNGDIPWSFTTKLKAESLPDLTPKASPSATLSPKANPTPSPEETATVPTIDETAVCTAIKKEYVYWDSKCLKEYPASLCARCMPRITPTKAP